MTKPNRPLILTVDIPELKLGELRIFSPKELGLAVVDGRFTAFMLKYSDWSVAEVDDLTVRELNEVAAAIGEQIKESAVPKATAPASEPGPA